MTTIRKHARDLKRWLRPSLKHARKGVIQRLRSGGSPSDKRTVFLCGMMRSGTNMVLSVLEKSIETQVFQESDVRLYENFVMREPRIVHRAIDRSPARRVVIKALLESHKADWLLAEFAPARCIWVYRNVYDSVNSQIRSFKSAPGVVERLVKEPNLDDWRAEGLTDELRQVLEQYYRDDLSAASRSALYWYIRNMSFFEQGLDERDDIYLLRYEDCVNTPTPTFETLFAWLGLDFRPEYTEHVFASSVGRHERPDIEPEIAQLCDDVVARFDALAGR